MEPHIADLHQKRNLVQPPNDNKARQQESSRSYLYNCMFPPLRKEHLFDAAVEIQCEATEKQAKSILILVKIIAG
jgi:hypothetical protein